MICTGSVQCMPAMEESFWSYRKMTYEEVINTIDNKNLFGVTCGRDATKVFMEALGHPDKGMKIIHIAGTNGKGSVAAFVSSILQAASFMSDKPFKVGLFTSPHLIEYTERIQIDGKQISKEDVARIGAMLLNINLGIEPTMFDYWLAMALVFFKEQGVKYVVLETGLGGNKDSTNGLMQQPMVCAITSIGLEHTKYLGNTLEAIAMEKAGIIKQGVPVVIGQMPNVAKDVIIACCNDKGARYSIADEVDESIQLGLFGDYQRKNAAVALEIVKNLDIEISDQAIIQGLKSARWPGRMQILSDSPFILVDGAHNPSGVKALHDSLVAQFPNEQFSFIMGVMADKNYAQMVEIIAPLAYEFHTVTVDTSRTLGAIELADTITGMGVKAKASLKYQDAVGEAAKSGRKIIVFGSLYFIGEVLNAEYSA